MFTLTFRTDTAAFDDHALPAEVAAILAKVTALVAAGQDEGPCHDTNGNRIGDWALINHRED